MDAKIHKKIWTCLYFVEISRLCILWQLLWGFAKSKPPASFPRPTAHDGPAARGPRPTTAQRPAAHGPWRPAARRPGSPVAQSWFSTAFLHRSASGYGAQNGRRWVWIRLPFNHFNPCFCLLHVVQIKNVFIPCSFVSLQKPMAQ